MGLYFLAMVLSIAQAQVPMASAFYSWQLLKVYFVYILVRRASSDPRTLEAILTGMSIALCMQVVLAGWQRFGHGELRAAGSLGDKNLLGFIVEFATFVPFAALLAGQRGWRMTITPVAGIVIAILTVSRAAVGFGVVGFGLVFVISSLRKWTPRKGRILAAGIIIILAAAPFAWYSFKDRFAEQPAGGADERVLLNNAAGMILHDHPFGIGANNYTVVANGQGYAQRAGVPWSNPFAIVHSVYWLTAAETGYFGLVTLLILWIRITVVSLRCAWKYTGDYRGDIQVGLAVTLIVVGLHNAYEWIFLVYSPEYLFAITAGLVAGLAEQLGYWGSRRQAAAAIPRPLRPVAAAASRHMLEGTDRKGAAE
jgi:hypothetical protein